MGAVGGGATDLAVGVAANLADIHVGLASCSDTIDLIPGDAQRARWSFDVTGVREDAGAPDFRGTQVMAPEAITR